ncbi:FkbM family methyltransferase [Pseudoalteromonas sp. T1lg65]|uniref:FkbM family methyltransferase n=1 Tax=Pseudoalteromonas sp. T1lg65 TaxID=2077101 RepID=UPI003F78F0AF
MINKQQLTPVKSTNLIRLGNQFDGGYVVPELQVKSANLLLSLGINDDWRFDKMFQSLNPECKIIGVDYTVTPSFIFKKTLQNTFKSLINTLINNKIKKQKYTTRLKNCVQFYAFFRGKNQFFTKKISDRNAGQEITLHQLIKNTAHENDKIFLKMDIEGAEYLVIDDLCKHADKIQTIAAEFHHLDTQTENFNAAIEKLKAHFQIVHIHGNNYGKLCPRNNFPETIELTLVNKSQLSEALPSSMQYPIEGLDYPNNPLKPDYSLNFVN